MRASSRPRVNFQAFCSSASSARVRSGASPSDGDALGDHRLDGARRLGRAQPIENAARHRRQIERQRMEFRAVDAREAQQPLAHARHPLRGIEHVLQVSAAVRIRTVRRNPRSARGQSRRSCAAAPAGHGRWCRSATRARGAIPPVPRAIPARLPARPPNVSLPAAVSTPGMVSAGEVSFKPHAHEGAPGPGTMPGYGASC